MAKDDDTVTDDRSNAADRRRWVAIPAIALAIALIGFGVAQLFGGDDQGPDVQVGGVTVERDDIETDDTVGDGTSTSVGIAVDTSTTTTVIIGESGVLDVEGDGNQVGLVPAQTEER